VADTILVVNAGSSSIKFQLFAIGAGDALERQIGGQLDGIGSRPRLKAKDQAGTVLIDRSFLRDEVSDVGAAQEMLDAWLEQAADVTPCAVGHRVVHGGPAHAAPAVVDETLLAELERLVPLAPLHQPNNLAPIRALRRLRPELLQVACFDTAFHRGHPELADRFAIPDALHQEGIRRYGFHGLSYEAIARRLPEVAPGIAQGRVIVAHLGSGSSMCALKAGRSVESTMSFTGLDGLPMGTRTGQLDPGVVLHLMSEKRMDAAAIARFLYHECGLKGLSGLSGDVRDLLASDAPGARLALDHFVYRIGLHAGMLAAAMGGLDGFVFTAGIGENAPVVRTMIGQRLAWLGLELDPEANARHGPCISTSQSRVAAFVIPTDEEGMIARHTLAILRGSPAAGPRTTPIDG
jgi:acetate kinase